jgi:hypothetical protein
MSIQTKPSIVLAHGIGAGRVHGLWHLTDTTLVPS